MWAEDVAHVIIIMFAECEIFHSIVLLRKEFFFRQIHEGNPALQRVMKLAPEERDWPSVVDDHRSSYQLHEPECCDADTKLVHSSNRSTRDVSRCGSVWDVTLHCLQLLLHTEHRLCGL